MAFSMSGVEDGYSYNRFDIYEKKEKDCGCKPKEDCDCDDKKKARGGAFIEREDEDGAGEGMSEGMDPVGKEDGDVDNDGDKDSSDKYLLNRRKAIAKAMGKKEKVAEGLTGMRADRARQMQDSDIKKGGGMRTDADRDTAFRLGTGTGPGRVGDKPIKSQTPQGKGNAAKRRMNEEEAEVSYTAAYLEGFKPFPKNKVQDKAAMKPDTPKGEMQARKMDRARIAHTDKDLKDIAKGAVKEREMDNKKKGLEKKFNAPSADDAGEKDRKNKAYKLEAGRRKDLDNRYGSKKEEIEASGLFTDSEIEAIAEALGLGK